MEWLAGGVGAALVVVALRDIFRTLWYPEGFGVFAHTVCRVVWRMTKPLSRRPRSAELGGPLGMLAAVLGWAALITVGFALVYWPHLPEGFTFGSSVDAPDRSGFLPALYLSLTALATLGLGDILPAAPGLRVVVPLQALTGFVLLTAGITWALQVYPALGRRRALAQRLTVLARDPETLHVVREGEPSVAAQLLHDVRSSLASVEADLRLYSETYYFREGDSTRSLAASAGVLLDLASAGEGSASAAVRHAARSLRRSTGEFADTLARQFLKDPGETEATLRAFARHHGHEFGTTG